MIVIGSIIYIVFRHDIIFLQWISQPSYTEEVKHFTTTNNNHLLYFVIYCLPDGLWYGALLIFQSAFHNETTISKYIFWFSVCLPFVWEVLQINSGISGTFDSMDLLAYVLVLSLFLFYKYHNHG